jgi:hypothetical protein
MELGEIRPNPLLLPPVAFGNVGSLTSFSADPTVSENVTSALREVITLALAVI